MGELLELLDLDGDGVISEEEFIDGVFQLLLFSTSPEAIQELKLLRNLTRKSEDISTALRKIDLKLEKCMEKI